MPGRPTQPSPICASRPGHLFPPPCIRGSMLSSPLLLPSLHPYFSILGTTPLINRVASYPQSIFFHSPFLLQSTRGNMFLSLLLYLLRRINFFIPAALTTKASSSSISSLPRLRSYILFFPLVNPSLYLYISTHENNQFRLSRGPCPSASFPPSLSALPFVPSSFYSSPSISSRG